MSNVQANITKYRTIAFGVSVAFALATFVLAALFISSLGSGLAVWFPFTGLSLATAIFTFITLPLLWYLSTYRKGVYFAKLIVELPWIGFLWILWLACAGSTASWDPIFSVASCDSRSMSYFMSGEQPTCHTGKAMIAFAFLNWILITAYIIAILYYAISAHRAADSSVWFSAITEYNWDAALSGNLKNNATTTAPQAVGGATGPIYNAPVYKGGEV